MPNSVKTIWPRLPIRLLIVGVLIALAPLTVQAGKKEAQALLDANQGPDAYAAYMELWRQAPSDDEVLLGLARSATLAGRHDRALPAYEILTRRYPDNAGLHRELAGIYRYFGNEDAARLEEEAANGISPKAAAPDPDGLLVTHGRVGMGVQYDSNITLGPDKRDVPVEEYVIRINADEDAKDAMGAYAEGRLDLHRRIAADSPWVLVADLAGSQTLNFGETDAITWGRLAAGFGYDTADWGAEIRAKGEEVRSDANELVSTAGLEGLLVYNLTPDLQLVTRGELTARDYTCGGRVGSRKWVGQYVRFRFGEDDHSLEVGGRVIANHATTSRYNSKAWETSARLRLTLPLDSEADLFAIFNQEDFPEPALAAIDKERKDDKLYTGIGLSHHLTETFSLEAGYRYTLYNSNTDIYDYDRHVISTGVAWSF